MDCLAKEINCCVHRSGTQHEVAIDVLLLYIDRPESGENANTVTDKEIL